MGDIYYVCLVGLLILFLLGLSVTIGYHHYKVRKKIVERASEFLSDAELDNLEQKLDEMLGRDVRELCSLNDSDFLNEIARIL